MTRADPSWLRRWWPLFTALAALVLVVGFGGPETVAVADSGIGGTYTEWIQDALGTADGDATWGWWVLTGGLVLFTVWFPVHLRNGWPWERKADRGT